MVGMFLMVMAAQVLICSGLALMQQRRTQRSSSLPPVAPWTLQAAYKIARQRHYNLLDSPWMMPVSGFYIADFFVSRVGGLHDYEKDDQGLDASNPPYENYNPTVGPSLLPTEDNTTDDLLKKIHEGDVVFCRHDYFEGFVYNLLPKLPVPIVLMTGMFSLRRVPISIELGRVLLASEKVLMWFATNPHFPYNFGEPWQRKYVAIPYGVRTDPALFQEALADGINIKALQTWSAKLEQFYWGPHTIRRRPGLDVDRPFVYDRTQPWPLSGEEHMSAKELLAKFLQARFTLSLRGDRADCFRHWEANIMGAIPVCNCHPSFTVFGNDTTVANTPYHFTYAGPSLISVTNEQMVTMLNEYKRNGRLPADVSAVASGTDSGNDLPYYYPSAEFVSYEFWCRRARQFKNQEGVDQRCGPKWLS